MRVLVIGAAGRLGAKLVEVLQGRHDVIGADVMGGTDTAVLDITDFAATHAFIGQSTPDIVLHAAAWTDVDGCAREPEKALAINGYGAQNVAIASAAINAAILYVSSNEVFDGRCCAPYHEYDNTGPVNPYGYSKLVGERAVAAANPRHYIVRTAWLLAHGGKNFAHSILNVASEGKPLRVVTDEVANPTYNNDLAEAIDELIRTGRFGTYHFTNAGSCSRYHFARYILDKTGYAEMPIEPISVREWKRDSFPPTYTALANTAGKMIGIVLRSWQDAVDAFLEQEGLLK